MADNQVNSLTEEQLVGLLRAKEVSAMGILYDKYSAALFGVIVRIVKNEETSEDVLQECFIKIWANFDSYDATKGRLFTWMLNICKNLAIDKIRSKQFKNEGKMQPVEEAKVQNLGQAASFKPEHIGLKEITEKLPPDQKQIIDLMYFDGFSQSEIAETYGIPLGTVKTRARSALKTLSKLLKDLE